MIEIDGKIYRNLEEQVRKNKEDIESIDTNVTSNTSAITGINNRLDNLDLTYATDEDVQNLQSQINTKANQSDLNSTNSRVGTLESTVTQLSPQVAKALKTPMSAPSSTELVAVDTSNGQAMISIGDGLTIENDTLKLSGGQQQQINIDNISITKNSDDQIQAVKLKDATVKVDSTIIYDNFNGVTKLSTQDYQTLSTYGQLTVNGETIVFDNNMLYLTPEGAGNSTTTGVTLKSEQFTGTTVTEFRDFISSKNVYSITMEIGSTGFTINVYETNIRSDGTISITESTQEIKPFFYPIKFYRTNDITFMSQGVQGDIITFIPNFSTLQYSKITNVAGTTRMISTGLNGSPIDILTNNTFTIEYFE